MSAVRKALQAPPFPLRLRPFRPPPQLLWKPDALHLPLGHFPLLLRGLTVSSAWVLVRSPLHSPAVRGVGGCLRASASASASDSAASSLPGVGVAGSLHSQESPVLAHPSPVASSVSAGCDHRSHSCEIGGSTGDFSRSRSSHLSLSRGQDSREGCRCAHSRSRGSRDRSCESLSLAPWTVRGLVDEVALAVTCPTPVLPVCGLADPGHGLLTATGTGECAHALTVTVHSLDECARICIAVARPGVTARGHTVPATGHMTVAGLMTALPFLLTARSRGRGVGGLDGIARIARRLLLLPRIAATLGQRWSPPLQLRVAPSLFSRPLSRTSSGCSSACRGPWNSGMRLLGLC